MIRFVVCTAYGIKIGNIELNDMVYLIGYYEITRNTNLDSSLNGIY